ncbi:hypothetical protein J6590_042731 [Homalodisca vitripennis]|nr:hypothetical protein J6590_042731 [Homalodisca vitripennis]
MANKTYGGWSVPNSLLVNEEVFGEGCVSFQLLSSAQKVLLTRIGRPSKTAWLQLTQRLSHDQTPLLTLRELTCSLFGD